MNDLRQHLLRWNGQRSKLRPNEFFAKRRTASSIIEVHALVRFADSVDVVDFVARHYGRLLPEFRGETGLPFSVTRNAESMWCVESCVLSERLPRSSYLLTEVPADVGNDWILV